jgi:hypothetical protein
MPRLVSLIPALCLASAATLAWSQTANVSFWVNKAPNTFNGNHIFLTYLQDHTLKRKFTGNRVNEVIFHNLSADLTQCNWSSRIVRSYTYSTTMGPARDTNWVYSTAQCNAGSNRPYQVLYAYRTSHTVSLFLKERGEYYIYAVSYAGRATGEKGYSNMANEDFAMGGPKVGDVTTSDGLKSLFQFSATHDDPAKPYCGYMRYWSPALRSYEYTWTCTSDRSAILY